MSSLRAAAVFGFVALLISTLFGCRSPGEGGTEPSPAKSSAADVTLKGVDTSALTAREKSDWSRLVSELLSPCADHPVSLTQCVNESRSCRACVPAAKLLVDLVRRGGTRSQVEAVYKARFSPEAVKQVDLSGAPREGSAGAKVVVAEFADFYCPACGAMKPVLDGILKKYPNDVQLVFKHFPLTNIHPNAEKAARAAVAAQRQNKFWEMHALLFENQEKLDGGGIDELAKRLGLDMKRFAQDRDSEATADAVSRDRKHGENLKLTGTPSLFVNGRPFVSTGESAEELEQWIALEIELVSGAPPAPAPAAAPAPSAAASASVAPTLTAAPVPSAAPAASR
jgi:protein-disulfide isomerase